MVSLSNAEWTEITKLLRQPADSASEERRSLAIVVAHFEAVVSRKAGTDQDIGGTINGLFRSGQLDCVDETVNTSTLLTMLVRDGFLRWHHGGNHAQRFDFWSDGAPHFSATVVDKQSNTTYVVDSWFRDSGQPADIVPLSAWQAGWNPK